ncbi:MAG: energy transducer TonB, partial [Deltaproteobacteria bacterium]|nr:energy transducer TonB [Nannocystaceae bacterium]
MRSSAGASRHATAIFAAAWLLGAAPLASAQSPPASAPTAETVAEQVIPPRPHGEIVFAYPDDLARSETPPAGTMVLRYVVTVLGTATEIEVVESVDPSIDADVVAALAALRFDPATLDGAPVEVVQMLSVVIAPPVRPEPAVTVVDAEPSPESEAQAEPERPAAVVRIRGRILVAGQRTPVR